MQPGAAHPDNVIMTTYRRSGVLFSARSDQPNTRTPTSRSATSAPDPDDGAPEIVGEGDAGPEEVGYTAEVVDRRVGLDRREVENLRKAAVDDADDNHDASEAPGPDRRRDNDSHYTGLERRRGPGRRRTDFTRQAEEGEMSPEQFLFLMAIDAFKRANGKTFPAWTDVLEVIRLLGYRKTCPSELSLPNSEDWTERADAPSNVRTKPGDDAPT
jgi:hypothetical protein